MSPRTVRTARPSPGGHLGVPGELLVGGVEAHHPGAGGRQDRRLLTAAGRGGTAPGHRPARRTRPGARAGWASGSPTSRRPGPAGSCRRRPAGTSGSRRRWTRGSRPRGCADGRRGRSWGVPCLGAGGTVAEWPPDGTALAWCLPDAGGRRRRARPVAPPARGVYGESAGAGPPHRRTIVNTPDPNAGPPAVPLREGGAAGHFRHPSGRRSRRATSGGTRSCCPGGPTGTGC